MANACALDDLLLRAATGGPSAGEPIGSELTEHLAVCSACRLVFAELLESGGSTARTPTPRVPSFRTGDLVGGRYQIQCLVGRGGMGDVYRAFDQVLHGAVALKTLASDIAVDSASAERLKAEVQLARRISHRNVCRIYDIGVHGSGPASLFFLTMELLNGETLRERLTRASLPVDEARVIALQVASALAEVHKSGVVHRDIKPENVMLVSGDAPDGERAVVMDFGLARPASVEHNSPGITAERSGWVSGTPTYIAPELRRGIPANIRSDIYAFGMMLTEIFSSLGGAAGKVADRWLTIARRCTAEDPGRRWPDFEAVLQAFQRTADPARGHGRLLRRWLPAPLALALGGPVALLLAGGASSHRPREGEAPASLALLVPPSPDRSPRAGSAAVVPSRTPALRPSAPSGASAREREKGKTRVAAGRTPSSTALTQAAGPHERLNEAEAMLLDDELTRACAAGESIRADAPNVAEVRRFLGRCYARTGRPADARAEYRRYLELSPRAPDAQFVRGMIASP